MDGTESILGAKPEQIDRRIRDKLGEHIIPLGTRGLSTILNDFLKEKSEKRRGNVVVRQACYNVTAETRTM